MKNLIIIVCDTLRHLGGLPAEAAPTTPTFFSRLQSQSMTVPGLLATSSWTVPSHLGLLTGGDPWEIYSHRAYPTRFRGIGLSKVWKDRGGESVAFSTNPTVSPRTGVLADYDEINPGFSASVSLATSQFLWGVDSVSTEVRYRTRHRSALTEGLLDGGATAVRALTRPAAGDAGLLRGVRNYLRSRRSDRPLHLFINLMTCHEPYTATMGYQDARAPLWMLAACDFGRVAFEGRYGERETRAMRQGYGQAVQSVQERLDGLWSDLERYGLLEDSCVVVTSDHGQSLGEHGFYGHNRYLHDELLKIPGFVYTRGKGSLPGTAAPWGKDPMDLRQLYHVLREVPGVGSADELNRKAMAVREGLGPAVTYVASHGSIRKMGKEPGPLVHTLRIFSPEGDLQVEEEGGRRRRTVHGSAEAVARLEPLVDSTLLSVPGSSAPRTPVVGTSLLSWGYE